MKRTMLLRDCFLVWHKTFLLALALAPCVSVVAMNEKSLQMLAEQAVYAKAKLLTQKITEKAETLKKILSDYQTYDVTNYEIERSIKTLGGLSENIMYLGTSGKIESAAIMLPSNLPLYSLVVFALIPSFMSKSVFVRPNSLLQERDIVTRLCDALDVETLFSGVHVTNTDHAGFRSYTKEADLVVFTGKPSNAENIIKEMKHNSVLVINGSGHNPVVVTDSADIEKAVSGSLLLKGFNGGQDCAGPDAILVHAKVAQEFTEKFHKKFSSLKCGQFQDSETIIGPINRFTELQKFAGILHNNRKDIISGGTIDFKNNIVAPTTIVRGIERYPNYQEVFGPIAFIHPYKKDQDLSYYFQDSDGQYQAHRMYVTLYGQSDYITSRDDTKNKNNPGNVGIVLKDQTIHDVEIGYKPYGGYSLGASSIMKKTFNGLQKLAAPVLIPQVIFEYLIKGKNLPFTETKQGLRDSLAPILSIKRDKQIDPIISDFQELAKKLFGENLVFGFIFGSAAKGKLKVEGPDRDDLDTFICINKEDKVATEAYIKKLGDLHHKYNLKVDGVFPAEIMTLATLEKTIGSLENIVVSVDKVVSGDEFDHMFWVHALTDKKIGFVGNGKVMSRLITNGSPYIYKWSGQIIEQLKKKDALPKYLCQTFSGLNKNEIIEKLSSYNPHLIVHLGLSYDESGKNSSI